ncbi:3-hydroxyacyl-CoA dehydrogenase NAD-binding domain-containing protein [Oscillatoria amoena NRMC-F 0135]|nr:3-hydroxyacyl-CoA dehydrogenase NAD-binding domain-containing protein [Oscillatoria amoena NRMC-F 0135]
MDSKSVHTIGIAGAGTMGQGIAQLCASSGYTVLLYDTSPALAERGKAAVTRTLEEMVKKDRLNAETKKSGDCKDCRG